MTHPTDSTGRVGERARAQRISLAFVLPGLALFWTATGGGCLSDPSANVGFNEPDPHARIRAARLAAETDDRAAIPDMIQMLNSDDAAERMTAIGALERMTGLTMGYRHFDPRPVRAEAIDRWTEWLREGEARSVKPNAASAGVTGETPDHAVVGASDHAPADPAPSSIR